MQTKPQTIKEELFDQTIDKESGQAVKAGTCTGTVAEDHVRIRAYHIWRELGEPDGQDANHWLLAEEELTRNTSAGHVSSNDSLRSGTTGVSSEDALRSGATGVSSEDMLRSGATGVSSKDALRSGATGVSSKDALRSGATGVSSNDALRRGANLK
jgi:hypothetical protein